MVGVKIFLIGLLAVLLVAVIPFGAIASPAPAPLLQSPAPGAQNVDPDTTLTWRWVDELMVNGSFETGMSPGWYVGGSNPESWQIITLTTNAYGMGYRLAEVTMPYHLTSANGQLIQDLYIPADAVSATLQWSERISDALPPSLLAARLRIMLFQSGAWVTTLEDALGSEPMFIGRNWVARSTNLVAYAGQSLQLVVQATFYAPQSYLMWYADVDGFSLSCEHASDPPEFQVLLGKSPTLKTTNQIGDTTALSLGAPPLDSLTTYFWRVGAVRDGVTNFSTTASFRTKQRVLPAMKVVGLTDTGVRLSFPTRSIRNYTIEQRDSLDTTESWYDILAVGQGTDGPMEVEVPLPWTGTAFWRLRVNP
jgi:hypothetical protein